MNQRVNGDILSVLPDNVKDSILTCLTIEEAVRTSILSQRWRYQWHSLSKISINDYSDLHGVSKAEFVKIIDHVLLFHYGSFDSFELDTQFSMPADVNRWILHLSRHGIKALILNTSVSQHYNLYIHLFSCSELTHLELSWCRFKISPATFKAFSNMRELVFNHCIFDNQILEKLINSCPLLSRLNLMDVNSSSFIRIDASKLVMLRVSYCNWSFPLSMNTPLLESAFFGSQCASNHQNCMFGLLGSLPLLQRLELNHFAMQELASGNIPARLPIVCQIKHLIVWINSENMNELLTAFCLFRSSPFIQMLDITLIHGSDKAIMAMGSSSVSEEFWKGEQDFSFKLDDLQEVKLTNFSGTECELKFIEFLFANASALETMAIKLRMGRKNVEDLFNVITKLNLFPRASPKAKLILPSTVML